MTHDAYKYCRRCGASLPEDSTFCESCGTRVEKPPPPPKPDPDLTPKAVSDAPGKTQYYEPVIESLPDASVAPRPFKAITTGWEILMQDIVGGILAAFLLAIGMILFGAVTLGFGMILAPIFLMGLLGWAEVRRREGRSNIDVLISTPFKYFGATLLWLLTSIVTGAVLTLPIIWIEVVSTSIGNPGSSLFSSLLTQVLMVVSFLVSPVFFSLFGLTAYAIARGETYAWSISWAFRRVIGKFFHWWLAGLLVGITAAIGQILCGIGLLVTVPLAALAWVVMASDPGEED